MFDRLWYWLLLWSCVIERDTFVNNLHGIQQKVEFSVVAMHMMANIAAAAFSVFLYCDGLCC